MQQYALGAGVGAIGGSVLIGGSAIGTVGGAAVGVQTGETKCGKPIIDWVITRSSTLNDAAKCVLVSFDSTMRSNLSVGMPIDLLCYRKDSLETTMRRRLGVGNACFLALGAQWNEDTREVFRRLPDLDWAAP